MQARLDLGPIKELIVFATHHIGETQQIGKDRSVTILPIQTSNCSLRREAMSWQIPLDSCHRPAQFLAVLTVPGVTKGAEPLMRMRLQYCGTGTDDFPALAPCVAGGTQLPQPTLGRRSILGMWQSALTGCLACAIDIKDEPVVALPIPEPCFLLLLFHERTSQYVLQKQSAQSFDWLRGQSGEKARERCAGR